jgi:hypothetical protein
MAIGGGSDPQFRSLLVEYEYRIGVLERVVQLLIQRFPIIGNPVSPPEMEQIRRDVIKELQEKYPSSQIKLEER